MKLIDFKNILNQMTDEELEQKLIYNSNELCISGEVLEIVKAEEDLYYTGEDDPSHLNTKKELEDEGYDEEDIEAFEIEVPKGCYYIKF